MSNGNMIPPVRNKYILEGRLVTMGPQGVIPKGAISIEASEIKHVLPTSSTVPAEFAEATRIRTGDTIYPGLIDLHNHLCYNAMPLWDVPQRYSNNCQWRNHTDYPRLITKPTQVLAATAGVVEALIRYVECRALLGGVTTSQGITLSSQPGIKSLYNGLVRNVEQDGGQNLPGAKTRIGNPGKGEAQNFLNTLQKQKGCYLQHLSEGVDDTARQWFLNLGLDNGEWAITPALCGIHSTALKMEDFVIMHARGGTMVWSPLSNYLLYGETVKLRAAKDAGMLIGIGSDWGPSGSKNLLGELKVAWLASQLQGDVFNAGEIVAMATINAARILNWDAALGSIEPGKRADFMVINGQSKDPFMQVIEARETEITLVIIDGIPRVGQTSLMKRFGFFPNQLETTRVGSATRLLNLADDSAPALVRDLELGEAIKRLEQAMQNLPTLAQNLDANASAGLFSGSVGGDGTILRVALDFESEPVDLALAALPLANFVTESMLLPGITVIDDPLYLPSLVASRNLPEAIKKGLPPLYGKEIPLPISGKFLRPKRDDLPPEVLATTTDLKTFLRTWGELSLADRQTIVDQALILLEQNYVHLPFKQAMHAVNPLQRLRLLRFRMENLREEALSPEIDFHNEMAQIFNSLRDLHTTYRLPYPFRGKYAWLPFLIEEYWEGDYRRYMVSKVIGQPGPSTFEAGVEVLYWNGMPIERVIAQNADRQAGSNLAARHARGLNSLTIRPLSHGQPPQEDWVTLKYRDKDGNLQEWTQEWLVFEPAVGVLSIDPEEDGILATALGLDPLTDDIQEAKRALYAGRVSLEERQTTEAGELKPIANIEGGLETYLPTIFRAMEIPNGDKTYGYIRIFTFNVLDADVFINEFVRLAQELPGEGLIIDVRGNGGGLIYAAELLLQVLTPGKIEPQKAQFINTAVNLQICRNHGPSIRFPGLDLKSWFDSIHQAVQTGTTYSLGFPITDEKMFNDWGQAYYGPVVLITDGLCYSATDMFAAGFQDHQIGPVLGISKNTGAGGANVWSHALLRELMNTDDPAALPSPYKPLPHGADLRVAIRRTLRVGAKAGEVVEDLGVIPDHVHRMTKRDLLEGNVDLIKAATDLLAQRKSHPIHVELLPTEGDLPRLRVETQNLTRLDVFFGGRPRGSLDVHGQETSIDLPVLVGKVVPKRRDLELKGYDGDVLVVGFRKVLD